MAGLGKHYFTAEKQVVRGHGFHPKRDLEDWCVFVVTFTSMPISSPKSRSRRCWSSYGPALRPTCSSVLHGTHPPPVRGLLSRDHPVPAQLSAWGVFRSARFRFPAISDIVGCDSRGQG